MVYLNLIYTYFVMRHLFLYALLTCSVITYSQVNRQVVSELFSNTRCSICGAKDPGIYQALAKFPQVTRITYYPSAPYSNCFFSQQNPIENDERTNHYNTYGSTPDIFLQGQLITGVFDTSDIRPFLGQQTDFEVVLRHSATTTGDSASVSCTVFRRGPDTLSSAQLFVCVTEDIVSYMAPNGINNHFSVFRKALTSASGMNIALPQQVGDSALYSFKYKISNGWDRTILTTVGILQTPDLNVVNSGKKRADISTPEEPNEPLGVDDTQIKHVILYPNPAKGTVYVSNSKLFESYAIFNINGASVQRGVVGEGEISIHSLPAGLYFVHLRDKTGEVKTLRFSVLN